MNGMKRNGVSAVWLLLALVACNTRVETVYDHHVNFGKYKSFCWMKGCEFTYTGPEYLADSAVRGYFKKAILEELATKGIAYASDQPDLLVDVHVTVENKTQVIYHPNQEPQIVLMPLGQPEVVEFLKGTLVMDIADRHEGRMIWRSVAQSYMDVHPELNEENIRKGIAKVLRNFPPPDSASKVDKAQK